MKYLRISITKYVQNISFIKRRSKNVESSCFEIATLNSKKMSVLSKFICEFNLIPNKMATECWAGNCVFIRESEGGERLENT